MKTITLEDFKAACQAQAESREQIVVICPMCETMQTAEDLIASGAGDTFDGVQGYLGYSCIGRFTGKGSPSQEKGKKHGCNWTLGGLFKIHKLEVITEDGQRHPHFELATREEADRYRADRGMGGFGSTGS